MSLVYRGRFEPFHSEVIECCKVGANLKLGEAIRLDRGSNLTYFGLRVPVIRRLSRTHFSFSDRSAVEILEIWDDLWNHSPYAEVLFLAIEYYLPQVKKGIDIPLWPVVVQWSKRVENWAHCDGLCSIYSYLLDTSPNAVLPQLEIWNSSDDQWLRRMSLVSLIHNTGKNSVFLLPSQVLPLVESCVEDKRDKIQKAVGWVVREMIAAYPVEMGSFVEANASRFSSSAFTRAISRCEPAEKQRYRKIREASRS